MINLPNIRQLQYLLALHEQQHFGKAALACHVSQSTLSAAISQLETFLQCSLLERHHKSFIFTAIGEQVVQDAQNIIQSSAELVQFTRNQSQPMAGRVVLGCIPTIAPFVLGNIAKQCRQHYGQLQLMLKEDTSENLFIGLSEGVIDIVLQALPYPTEGFEQLILAKDRFNLVVHNALVERYLAAPDLSLLPDQCIFLLQKEHCLAEQTTTMCHLLEDRMINPFLAASLHTLVQMVDSHQGATYLPQMAINSGILNGTQLRVMTTDHTAAHRTIAALWRPSSRSVDTYQNIMALISPAVSNICAV